nr:MAG TPA: hypothetical protein [Bacteriophage sp.]
MPPVGNHTTNFWQPRYEGPSHLLPSCGYDALPA